LDGRVLEAAVATVPDEDTVIALDRVSVIRGGNHLLRGLTWQVELDERWVILGPNGAGKTTLLNLACTRRAAPRTCWASGSAGPTSTSCVPGSV
jgi:iron complex transport system ATP-binding protein